MQLAYWTNNLDPYIFRLNNGFGVRYYGMAYALSFVIAYCLLSFYHSKSRLALERAELLQLVANLACGAVIGGRIGYFLLYKPAELAADPMVLIRKGGGMSSHGGFVGVILAIYLFSRQYRVSFVRLGEIVTTVVPQGLFWGRVANFINGELCGVQSNLPWAVIFPRSGGVLPRHPSQLYAALLEGLVLFIWMQWRFWRTDIVTKVPGQLAGEFLVGYALLRFVGELYREPDAPLIGMMSRGVFYSCFCLVAGIGLMIYARVRTVPCSDERELEGI